MVKLMPSTATSAFEHQIAPISGESRSGRPRLAEVLDARERTARVDVSLNDVAAKPRRWSDRVRD